MKLDPEERLFPSPPNEGSPSTGFDPHFPTSQPCPVEQTRTYDPNQVFDFTPASGDGIPGAGSDV